MATVASRACKTCQQTKPCGGFYFRRDGRLSSTECRDCTRARSSTNAISARASARQERAVEAARLRALSHKVCPRCSTEKTHDAFYAEPSRRDGLSSWCKDCCRAATRESAAKRRAVEGPRKPTAEQAAKRKVLADLAVAAKSGPCVDCGEAFPPQIMHFHHRDPAEKVAGVAVLVRRYVSPAVLRAEIAKCVVLCPNCHALRHFRGEARPEEVI